jgi:hypothetical protein
VTGDGRRLHNKELFVLYTSLNIDTIKKNEMGRARGMYEKQEGSIKGFGR